MSGGQTLAPLSGGRGRSVVIVGAVVASEGTGGAQSAQTWEVEGGGREGSRHGRSGNGAGLEGVLARGVGGGRSRPADWRTP